MARCSCVFGIMVLRFVCGRCGAGLMALAASLGSAQATTVSLLPSKDNTLYESFFGELSNGAGEYFFVGTTAQNFIRRGMIAFDVADALPSDAVVTSVTLRLSMTRTAAGSEIVSVHRALADWGEGASVGHGEEGNGGPSEPGDATWFHTFYDDRFWQNPGGDFEADSHADQVVIGLGDYFWGPTAQLTADVQGWLNDPASNFGWMITADEEFFPTSKRFATREHIDPELRPVLTIEYTPEPGASLAVAAMLAAIRRKRRPHP